jgi:N-acetylglucosamine-6-phosphate deacetylase
VSVERRLGVAAALVDGELLPGDIAVAGGEVVRVGLPGAGTGIAVPGLVDLQVNGFAGVDLLGAGDDDAWRHVARRLLDAGVTAWQPTLITGPPERTTAALRRVERLRHDDRPAARILGAHLEGPFIAAARLGAHPAAHRRDPDPALLRAFLDAGPVSMVTLAPELPGALELVDALVARGVTVSVGHSDASAAEATAAFERGAAGATHLFNAMGGIAAREPGVAGVALAHPRVIVQCVADGVHLADETLRVILAAARSRVALVSDAMAAAGMGDGDHRLGEVAVRVREGRATVADGTLAGGVGTVLDGVRRLVALGAPLAEAVAAATSAPARLIGRRDAGALRVGAVADVVVLAEDLSIRRVILRGAEVEASGDRCGPQFDRPVT